MPRSPSADEAGLSRACCDRSELAGIEAVIIGGATLSAGYGTMLSTIIGVYLLGVVSNAFIFFGVSSFWQPVATDSILIVAVTLDSATAHSGRTVR